MTTINPTLGRFLAGVGGAALSASLFLPWVENVGAERDGWEALPSLDVLLVVVGLHALVAAITGGRFGYFRPDLSLNAAADILAVVTGVVVAWWLLFDVPDGASSDLGAYVALVAATAAASGAGDFRITSLFPRME